MHLKKLRREIVKRTACIMLAAGLVFTGQPAQLLFESGVIEAKADFIYSEGSLVYNYSVNDDNTVTIKGWNGTDKEMTIPSSINGMSVTSIGDYAFYSCSSLRSITIPEGVTSIGKSAFYYDALSDINVSENNQTYTSVEGVLYNKDVTEVIRCPGGKTGDYVLPDTVTSIGDSAFEGRSSLTSITIPEGVTSIGSSAFKNCSGLTSIKIPEVVTSIGDSAFEGCSSLTSITIPEGVTSIGSSAFKNCSSMTSITIPEVVTSIGDWAFYMCDGLTSVTIPDSVTSIGDNAFSSCGNLTEIKIGGKGLTSIGNSVFLGCKSLTSITIPDSVTSIGNMAFEYCSSLTSITIPDSVTSIGNMAFYECRSLSDIKIPKDVTSISNMAFAYCSSLTSITIPEKVTDIGNYAFGACSSLKDITISESVESIGDNVFFNCIGLNTIKIPKNVSSIGSKAIGYYLDNTTHEQVKNEDFVIYGYTGTAAETYANENGFKFVPYEIKEDASGSGVQIEYPEGTVDDSITIIVKPIGKDHKEYENIKPIEDVDFKAYDISLNDKDNVKVQPNGKIKVRIPCPEGFEPDKCRVYYVSSEGKHVNMKAEYSDGFLVFETKHFSIYMVTADKLSDEVEYIYGDANGDGNIDSKDAVLLKKYIAGYEGLTIDLEAADVNADGTVNSKDAVKLMKYIAGYDVVLGEM